MKNFFLYLMIYAGSALMAYNIYRYVCFSRDVRKHGNWDRELKLFNLPIMLLILFFIGYLIVGIFGRPDLVMAGILFGGSIFVFVMLLLILPDPALAGIPIIAMTANAFQEDIKKAEAVGMNGHIAKPLDVPDMKATLQQVLKNNMQRRAVYSGGEEE